MFYLPYLLLLLLEIYHVPPYKIDKCIVYIYMKNDFPVQHIG